MIILIFDNHAFKTWDCKCPFHRRLVLLYSFQNRYWLQENERRVSVRVNNNQIYINKSVK